MTAPRLLLRRAVHQRAMLAAAVAVLLPALVLVTLIGMHASAVRAALKAMAPDTRTVRVVYGSGTQWEATPDQRAAFFAQLHQHVAAAFAGVGSEVDTTVVSGPYVLLNSSISSTDAVAFWSSGALKDKARLLQGTWPTAAPTTANTAATTAFSAVVSESALTLHHWHVGDTVATRSGWDSSSALTFRITGVYRPVDPADRFWLHDGDEAPVLVDASVTARPDILLTQAAVSATPDPAGFPAGRLLTAFVGAAGISGVASAPANVAVLAADSGGLRALTRRAASESGGRSGQVPADWPMRPSRPGTVTALVSPGLAGLVGTHATLALPAETVEVDFVAAADLPTASVIAGEYGPGYVVLPADQMGAKAVKPDAVWVTGHPDIKALRALPGVQPYFPSGSYAQASAAGYADGRTTAAHAVLRMAELLSIGFGLLCLAQTMAGSRSAARDSALLLRVLGLSESGGRLLGPATTLPLLALATAGGLAMGASFAPLLGAQVPGVPRDGWLVPVIGVVAVCTVGGVVLEAALRRRERASVRLRAAEFE